MRKSVTIATLAITILCMVIGLAPQAAGASSHREAPLIKDDPVADNTDVYAFVSPDDPTTVTLIANFIPMEEPAGGPNWYAFSPQVRYAIAVDNNGDANPDITFYWTFSNTVLNPNTFLYNTCEITSISSTCWNERQTYSLWVKKGSRMTQLGADLPEPPVNIGPASTPNYSTLASEAITTVALPGSGHLRATLFAGQRDDPFFVDFSLFDLLTIRPGAPGNTGGGVNGLAGFSVHSLAIKLPIQFLTACGCIPSGPGDPNAVVGVWSYAQRKHESVLQANGEPPKTKGSWVQVSELGNPLVNEVVIPVGQKDLWNATPVDGGAQSIFANSVITPELPGLLTAIYGLSVPPPPRTDLVQVFLTGLPGLNEPMNCPSTGCVASEQMRLNVGYLPGQGLCATYSNLGVIGGDYCGFPNGRRLGDDVVDIELRVVAGVLVPGYNVPPNNELGDGVNGDDQPLLPSFPYLATPIAGYNSPHGLCYSTPTNPTCNGVETMLLRRLEY